MVEYPLVYIFGGNGQKLKMQKSENKPMHYQLSLINMQELWLFLSRFENPEAFSFTDP